MYALREEGDDAATQTHHGARHTVHISIRALREEGDTGLHRGRSWPVDFYPRPPRGGRQQKRRKTSPLLFHYKTICTDLEELFQKHPKKNSCDLHRTA